jgi:hypothetical protein
MPSTKYLKAKERLTLALYIENLNKEANPCLYYRRQVRRYLIDLKESSCYSEYIYSKRSCNSSSLKTTPIILKRVCCFFIGPMP